MEPMNIQHTTHIYNQHIRRPYHKNSMKTSATINDSLPVIKNPQCQEKVNTVRHQVSKTKSQIMLMEAKLHNLKKMKEKFEHRSIQNQSKMRFLNQVKERVRQQAEIKQRIQFQHQQQLQTLQYQTSYIRSSLQFQTKNAKQQLLEMKEENAKAERQKSKHCQYLIQKLKELDKLQKMKKVDKIKQFHQLSSSRHRQYEASRVQFSRQNYHQKLKSTIQERNRVNRTLQIMKQEQERLLSEVKASEASMLTSLYNLESANPEKSKQFRFGSNSKVHKAKKESISPKKEEQQSEYDIDNYENEDFQN